MSMSDLSTHSKTIYTDGGCHNNDPDKGVGSWAFLQPITDDNGMVNIFAGYQGDTTNNRTEMLAVINGIKIMDYKELNIISDSGYVVKGYNHPAYLDRWVANGWKTSTGTDVMNQDLWRELLTLTYHHGIKFQLIRGHGKDISIEHAYWNSIVDQACTWIMKNHREDGVVLLQYDTVFKKISKYLVIYDTIIDRVYIRSE